MKWKDVPFSDTKVATPKEPILALGHKYFKLKDAGENYFVIADEDIRVVISNILNMYPNRDYSDHIKVKPDAPVHRRARRVP
jgi:hypothetical protein